MCLKLNNFCGCSLRLGSQFIAFLFMSLAIWQCQDLSHGRLNEVVAGSHSAYVVLLLNCFLQIILNAALSYGVFKSRLEYMTPWLFYQGILLVACIVGCFVVNSMVMSEMTSEYIAIIILLEIVFICFYYYCISIVYNLFRKIELALHDAAGANTIELKDAVGVVV